MIDLGQTHKQAQKLESLLRLQSPPLALKMVEREDDIPEDAQRPVRDMGHHLSFCQALALSRRHRLTIAQTKEDMWCFEPVVGLGFVKPPPRFLDGHTRYPEMSCSLEAGSTWAKNMPRFAYGTYSAVLSAPLEAASFEPDIFLVFGAPAKMTQIMIVKNWLDGRDIKPTISGNAACIYYVVPPIKEKTWHISLPCGGDLRRAACEDYNMVFSAPVEVLSDLLAGLEEILNKGLGLPPQVSPAIEYPLPKNYVEVGKSIGMDWVR